MTDKSQRIQKAKTHFLGKDNHKKLNCAQAVAEAFRDVFSLSEEEFKSLESCGSGKAPDGLCGACHAACVLLKKKHPGQVSTCKEFLLTCASSTQCKEIRKLNKLSCLECVEKMAQFLNET